ncbi:MAG TPA: oxidoreductase, partial [Chitinophagaceae bacterium]|nr:oxidoreductase [Chitinophagaceae bacterium]
NLHTDVAAAGELELERADVNWQLSIEENALPLPVKAAGKQTYRVLTIDGESFDFSEGFADLHTQSYAAILSGHGFPLVETREVIRLVQEIRSS